LRLFEHPVFEQAILRAAEHFRERKLRPAIIEKDYYVTEALGVIATTSGDKIIFKSGTSLAKGWNLIERFSEDIHIFLVPIAFDSLSFYAKKLADLVVQEFLVRRAAAGAGGVSP
jgi:predicted nucleotidyltransferase component of viral defense system